MGDISFADGMKILAHMRSAQTAATPPAQTPMAAMPKYGPHNPVLSDEQAATLHLVWSIMGIDGNTVGKGQSTPEIATKENT